MSLKNIEYIDIDSLIPYINNTKTHDSKQITKLASSIQEFGYINPIIINNDYSILAGHARLLAAQKLQLKQVPVIKVSHLSKAQQKAYRIADNRIAEDAQWDDELLAIELDDLKAELDLSITGFEDDELERILASITSDKTFLTDEDDCPELPETPISQLGDIWMLGDHKLICGDSTIKECLEELLENEQVNLLITDPPYNVDYSKSDKGKILNDSMSSSEFKKFLFSAFSAANNFLKKGSSFYIWHSDIEAINFRQSILENDWKISSTLIWVKNHFVLSRCDYQPKHEPCLFGITSAYEDDHESCIYGWKKGLSHRWYSDRKQSTILEFDKPVINTDHPTMKPVGLFQKQITNSTKSNEIVLDIFGGSGTTLIACEKTNRRARLVELDPKYCDVIIKRWQEFTGQEAINIKQGKKFSDCV